jgi:hypothetical protein
MPPIRLLIRSCNTKPMASAADPKAPRKASCEGGGCVFPVRREIRAPTSGASRLRNHYSDESSLTLFLLREFAAEAAERRIEGLADFERLSFPDSSQICLSPD